PAGRGGPRPGDRPRGRRRPRRPGRRRERARPRDHVLLHPPGRLGRRRPRRPQRGPHIMSPSPRILIVDDEPNIRLVLRTALASPDYTLATAEDGETALMWLQAYPFDLVLLDLQMPQIDGMDVLEALRASGN